ncbi:HNH endonuclease [Pseudomonas sp. MAP12]|uniref:HNH endonuclease n=1 Tax=Geopseudomonas aromaticivorans TaxID=2849492 RepID=A0ABS6MTD7_9GAMM|nr:HNH endonuclease [Pseudomonas aromaticivorans]MBV2132072.1 HNH endonuclease [Pseudomonas aromaticivorans]
MEPKSKEQWRAFLEKAIENAPPVSPARAIRPVSVGEYVQALSKIEADITENQRSMLTGHAMSPGQSLTMSELAALVGFPSYSAANLQYGLLAGKLVDVLGIVRPKFLVYAIASFDDDPETAHSRAHMYPELYQALQQLGWIPAVSAVKADDEESDTTSTERQQFSVARIGQEQFRSALLAFWGGRCALTGCDLLPTLVASYIRPWSLSNSSQRLDPFNGLLLSANADRLFDQGLMSFAGSGLMLLKSIVTDEQLGALGLSRNQSLMRVAPEHLPYLAAHRALHGF